MKTLFWHRGGQMLCAGLLWVMMAPVPGASAADTIWTAGSGNFTNPANWSAGVPDANTNANFTSASSYTVSLTSDATSSNAFFNPTSGTVTLDLGGNTWLVPGLFWVGQNASANSTVIMSGGTLVVTNAAGTGDFTVGRFGLGAFSLGGGTLLSQGGTVGFTGNGNLIEVSGSSTVWSNSGNYFLGYLGVNSRIVVSNNATFHAGSGILHIGYAGKTNSLIIADGGVVNSATVYFSTDAASGGRDNSALVTGNNSLWNNSSGMLLGMNGGGNSMVVSNNATVRTSTLNVGHNSGTNTLTIHTGANVFATNVNISLAGTLATNRIVVAGGNLIVTNSTAGAALNLGGVNSELSLQGGLVRADKLTVSASTLNNVGGTVTAAQFNVVGGTVNTSNGSTTDVGAAVLYLGNTAGQTGRWNVVSGTNTIKSGSTRLSGDAAGIVGIMTVLGPDTFLNHIGGLEVGRTGNNALLVITNGARVDVSGSASVGGLQGSGNTAIVTGTNSTWNLNNSLAMFLGYIGPQNQIVITNGGFVNASAGTFYIGYSSGGNSNRVLISDGGRLDAAHITFGQAGATSNNLIQVEGSGSLLQAPSMVLSINSGAQANQLTVTNGGTARLGTLYVGEAGSRNRAEVGTGGTLIVTNHLIIGNGAASTANLVMVAGGTLVITNSAGNDKLVIGNAGEGTFTLNGGSVLVDHLFATNGVKSVVNLQAGTLTTRSTTVSNTTAFAVGDGIQVAMLKLNGGSHLFANGLTVANNGTLAGTGAVNSVVSVANGGALAPGMSPGTLTINSNLTLGSLSLLNFELGPHDINGNGYVGGGTNDLIVINGDLILDGILNVTALPGWDLIGNTRTNVFRLFDYTGTLTDNSLTFGLLPGDVNAAFIDTSISGQINLIVVIPEPSALPLIAFGLVGLLVRRRQ